MCYKVDTIFFSLFFYFTISSHIYTYKDHSLQSVVHRPYSGLTFPLIFFITTFTSVDCLVATAEHCLVSFRTGSGLTHCPSYF